jgi:hypothetical protein
MRFTTLKQVTQRAAIPVNTGVLCYQFNSLMKTIKCSLRADSGTSGFKNAAMLMCTFAMFPFCAARSSQADRSRLPGPRLKPVRP